MIARKLISLLTSSACFSRIVAPDAQLEEGNHEYTSQRCIGTWPGNEEFRSIRSTRHALTWAQARPRQGPLDRHCHLLPGNVCCQPSWVGHATPNHLYFLLCGLAAFSCCCQDA